MPSGYIKGDSGDLTSPELEGKAKRDFVQAALEKAFVMPPTYSHRPCMYQSAIHMPVRSLYSCECHPLMADIF